MSNVVPSLRPFSLRADPNKPARIVQKENGMLVLQYYDIEGNLREIPVVLAVLPQEIAELKDQLRLTRLFALLDINIESSNVMVPVDIQSSYIMVPVDIQGQAIDLVTVTKYTEGNVSRTGIDAETDVLDLDVRLYKHLGIAMKNTGSNDLVYRIVGYRKYDGSLVHEIVSTTTLSAGAQDYKELDVSKYARIIVKVAAATSGNPSDINVEYILKA